MATSQAEQPSAGSVPARGSVWTVTVAVHADVPHPKDKLIRCRFCEWTGPRWLDVEAVKAGEPRTSGLWTLLAHQIECHRSRVVRGVAA